MGWFDEEFQASRAPERERRRYLRLDLSMPVFRQTREGFVPEQSLNVCFEGMALATRELLRPGELLELLLASPDGWSEVPLHAEVRHVRNLGEGAFPYAAGLRFTHIDSAVRPQFEALLLHLLMIVDGKRLRRRLELNTEALWGSGGTASPEAVRLLDLSLGGAQLSGPQLPTQGQRGELTLINPADGEMQGIPSVCVWQRSRADRDLAGVRFEPDTAQRSFLARALRGYFFSPRRVQLPSQPAPGGIRVGGFELREQIGSGRLCDVYRGLGVEEPYTGQAVALKRLRPEHADDVNAMDRLLTEADLGRILQHPGVVRVHSALTFSGELWVAMELVKGRSLADLLAVYTARQSRLPISTVVSIARELLEILDACHRATTPSGRLLDIVHGDVTPSNVLISRHGDVKLTDFGMAANVAELSEVPVSGAKLFYLAPELHLRNERPTSLIDVYQTGVLLYEVLTGVVPFKADTPEALCRVIKRGPIPPSKLNGEVSPTLEKAILGALTASPEKRPPSARAFAELLLASGQCAAEGRRAHAQLYAGLTDGSGAAA